MKVLTMLKSDWLYIIFWTWYTSSFTSWHEVECEDAKSLPSIQQLLTWSRHHHHNLNGLSPLNLTKSFFRYSSPSPPPSSLYTLLLHCSNLIIFHRHHQTTTSPTFFCFHFNAPIFTPLITKLFVLHLIKPPPLDRF